MSPFVKRVFCAALAVLLPTWSVAADPAGPRAGTYQILSYGRVGAPPLSLGKFTLDGAGNYESFLPGGRSAGKGTYEFDAAKSEVTWKTGPFQADGWTGEFTIEREGKTHKIRLKRTTIGTNSTDSGN